MEEIEELELEAKELYGCEKPIFNYIVESAGSIGSTEKSDE